MIEKWGFVVCITFLDTRKVAKEILFIPSFVLIQKKQKIKTCLCRQAGLQMIC
jgi:hypothetical protein